MRAWELNKFGLDNLTLVEREKPTIGPTEVLVQLHAASINPRDQQIVSGHFSQDVNFPLIPLSDGAGTVVEVGNQVSRVAVGDRVTPLFFPNWMDGDAHSGERSISGGLETHGVLRDFGVYSQDAVVAIAEHLSFAEAACLPCAGLTAWTSLVPIANITSANSVLIQGTGGVAIAALQFAKAIGATVIILSSSDKKLARAKRLGADHCINYIDIPNWGEKVFQLAGQGVDLVLEIGGTGTMENSLAAIRNGGHIAIIGYMAGADMGISVFPLIIKCAHLHGIATGNRENYAAMMNFIEEHSIQPEIGTRYAFKDANKALADLVQGTHFGKLVIDYQL